MNLWGSTTVVFYYYYKDSICICIELCGLKGVTNHNFPLKLFKLLKHFCSNRPGGLLT